jgi:hypothetical protein
MAAGGYCTKNPLHQKEAMTGLDYLSPGITRNRINHINQNPELHKCRRKVTVNAISQNGVCQFQDGCHTLGPL